ncbi:MAG: hypothetical protein K8S27_01210 [Candidatus Omnitrophica bacterium]|nr:hypothetical protein [Candidatus Omnitrophota bacterium]
MFDHPGAVLIMAIVFILVSGLLYLTSNMKSKFGGKEGGRPTLGGVPRHENIFQQYFDINSRYLIYIVVGFFVLSAIWFVLHAFLKGYALRWLAFIVGGIFIWLARGIWDRRPKFRKYAMVVLVFTTIISLGNIDFLGILMNVIIFILLYHPRLVEVLE